MKKLIMMLLITALLFAFAKPIMADVNVTVAVDSG